jgi:dihydrofolate reductase
MTISLIVAVSDNGVIGAKNQMPWHLSADLQRFKKITSGHPVIMGRKTFESIKKPLPNRTNIVISRQDFSATGCIAAKSIEEAIAKAKKCDGKDEIFIIGGAEIYRQSVELVQRMYITRVHIKVAGDTYFPELDWSKFKLVSSDRTKSVEKIPAYSFDLFERTLK